MKHEYADILEAIAANKNVKLQRTYASGVLWENIDVTAAFNIILHGCADRIRITPETIRIGDMDVPMPMQVVPAEGTKYWAVSVADKEMSFPSTWTSHSLDFLRLKRNICHLTLANCLIHAKAVVKNNGGEV